MNKKITKLELEYTISSLGFHLRRSSLPDQIEARKAVDIRAFFVNYLHNKVYTVIFVNGLLDEDKRMIHKCLFKKGIRHHFCGKILTVHN